MELGHILDLANCDIMEASDLFLQPRNISELEDRSKALLDWNSNMLWLGKKNAS